ncbi:hypothetical protein AB0C31_51750, partial [Actinoplanes philippinensis]
MRIHPRAWLAVAVVVMVVAAGGWAAVGAGDDASPEDGTAVDVLTGHDWTRFAGATVGPGGVRITGTGGPAPPRRPPRRPPTWSASPPCGNVRPATPSPT